MRIYISRYPLVFLALAAGVAVTFGCRVRREANSVGADYDRATRPSGKSHRAMREQVEDRVERTEAEWRELLTEEEYRVLREGGTEQAYSGEYWDCKELGIYHCAGCGNPLFRSVAKFDSGTGWPSFYKAIRGSTDTKLDRGWIQTRREVLCARCDSHLGHVFQDGPAPTGLRYCMNSVALDFSPRQNNREDEE